MKNKIYNLLKKHGIPMLITSVVSMAIPLSVQYWQHLNFQKDFERRVLESDREFNSKKIAERKLQTKEWMAKDVSFKVKLTAYCEYRMLGGNSTIKDYMNELGIQDSMCTQKIQQDIYNNHIINHFEYEVNPDLPQFELKDLYKDVKRVRIGD